MSEATASPMNVELTEAQKAAIAALAQSDIYVNNPVPDELLADFKPRLLDFAMISRTNRDKLPALYQGVPNPEQYLLADWEYALEAKAFYLFSPGRVNFATRRRLANGSLAEITIAQYNRPDDGSPTWRPWIVLRLPPETLLNSTEEPPADTPAITEDIPLEPVPTQPIQEMLALRMTRDYLQGRVPEDILEELKASGKPFSKLAFMPKKHADKIIAKAGFAFDVHEMLDRDFATALENNIVRSYQDKIIFPIGVLRSDGEKPLEVIMVRNRVTGKSGVTPPPWFVLYVDDFVKENAEAKVALEKWANITNWNSMLSTLAATALPEMWDFDSDGTSANETYPILKNYLTYTFYHLQLEDKVCMNEEAGFAAFNTGLVNELYEPLYACFSKEGDQDASWSFTGFCRAGSRTLGKQLVRMFNPLPERAQYFSRKEDLLFDTDQPLELDSDHILLDNISRLPVDFLQDELDGNAESREIVNELAECTDVMRRHELFGELKEVIADNPRLLRRLMNRLDDAVEVALKRVEWNFKTAVPAFFPRRNSMSLLLPLDLTEDDAPDIALVCEHTESNAYLGQTILTMRMAYKNARLICRPDSDWLDTSVRMIPGEDADEDDE